MRREDRDKPRPQARERITKTEDWTITEPAERQFFEPQRSVAEVLAAEDAEQRVFHRFHPEYAE